MFMTNDLHSLIKNIMNNFPEDLNDGTSSKKLVSHGLQSIDEIQDLAINGFVFYGSYGEGNLAHVPWMGLFDTNNFSKQAKSGIYIVYLFSYDMQRVYLSLNQGWSNFKKQFKAKLGKKKIHDKSVELRRVINLDERDYVLDDMDLSDNKSPLPSGYIAANIVSIRYDLSNIPNNTSLVNDLRKMKQLLIDLENKLYIKENDDGSFTYHLKKNVKNTILSNGDKIDKSISNISSVKYSSPKTIPNCDDFKEYKYDGNANKKDYIIQHINNKNLGDFGEKLVVGLERAKLIKFGYPTLAKKVDQVSESEGDGLGYDVESFDINGNKIYIEVKTTTHKNKSHPFNLSLNELAASTEFNDQYKLYRLYNVDINNSYSDKEIDYYIVDGPLNDGKLNMRPKSYDVTPKIS